MNRLIKYKWLFVLLTAIEAHAQTPVTIKGRVTDKVKGQAIDGVTVVEVNEKDRQINGANTDANGNYTIRVSNTANRLRFSFIGFESKRKL